MDARVEHSFGAFTQIEESFHEALSESLEPRGPEVLYDLVAALGLRPGSAAVDIGCGEGIHTAALASRFGLDVLGVDPVARPTGIRFEPGTAERLPLPDESVDLAWCRDMLSHVADLPAAFAEMHRVLRDGGRALVYVMLASDRLEAREAEELWRLGGLVGGSFDGEAVEAAIAGAGLRIDQRVEIGSEWGEHAEEATGKPGKRLLWAARLLRDPDRYVEAFGRANYEVMLGDCLWHAYVLTKPS
jgi:SAM-dependent methyltransferase